MSELFNMEQNEIKSQTINSTTKKFKNPNLIYYNVKENTENGFNILHININILVGNDIQK